MIPRLSKLITLLFIAIFLASCSEDNVVNGGEETVTHSSDITQDETWAKGTHYIDGHLYVSNAVLTIEPGATIIFKSGGRLVIGENGGLIADGSTEAITFTGEQKQNGYWEYVEIDYNAIASKCILKNVIMEYGGGYSSSSHMFVLYNNAIVQNCTFRYSGSNGVEIGDHIAPTFTNNVVTSCTGYPIEMDFTSCNCLQLGTGTLQGNGKDYVLLNSTSLTQDATLHKIDVPYRFDGIFHIESPATLTIEAGNICEMNSGARIQVADGAGMIAVGTQMNPIYFTGAVKQAGYWEYIEFFPNASNANSKLQYVVIEYGGGYSATSAELIVWNNATIQNCTIQNSASYGCIVEDGAFPIFSQDSLRSNSKAPLYAYFSNVGKMDLGSCDFSGNSESFIYVDMNSSIQNAVLQKTNVPYLFDGIGYVDNNSTFTIEPGVTIQMGVDSRLVVTDGSTLVADGTNEMITITGQLQQKGYWEYIEFFPLASNNSRLINCTIEYGGGYATDSGMIIVENSPKITGCTIQHSYSNGIYIVTSTGSDINISGNTFNDNNGMDIFYY